MQFGCNNKIIFRKFQKCMRHPKPRCNVMRNLYEVVINYSPSVPVILAFLDVLAGQWSRALQAYPSLKSVINKVKTYKYAVHQVCFLFFQPPDKV